MSLDPRFAKTVWVTEIGGSFEELVLWRDATTAGRKWVQDNGTMVTVGMIEQSNGLFKKPEKRPVCISVAWSRIDGQLVAFWEAISQIADYKMISEWWDQNCAPKTHDGRRARSDAMNFGHCLGEIDYLNRVPNRI